MFVGMGFGELPEVQSEEAFEGLKAC